MRPIYVTFVTRSGPQTYSHGGAVRDGWSHWHCQAPSRLTGVLLSEGTLVELWIGLDQQLAQPISAGRLREMALAGVTLPVPPVQPGVVVRAKVIPPPDPAPDGASSGR